MEKKVVLAVDLGQENTRMAALDDLGKPRIIPSSAREDFIPTCLFYKGNGEFVLGRTALNERALQPEMVSSNFKMHVGSEKVVFNQDGVEKTATELYAEVLKQIKVQAESYIQSKVEDVVLASPARWGTTERRQMEKATNLAGLNLKKIVSEPTAAAVAYQEKSPGKTFLVVDIGSHTTDVSIVQTSKKDGSVLYKVIVTEGEMVGGQDIDRRVKEAVLEEMKKDGIIPDEKDVVFDVILQGLCQHLKEALSDLNEKSILVDHSGNRRTIKMTRDELENISEGETNRMLGLCTKAVEDANLNWQEITAVIPVGGPARTPAILRGLEAFGPPVHTDVDPDRAVAYGCAIIAGKTGGLSIDGKLLSPSKMEVAEVVSMDIGVLAIDGQTGSEQVITLVSANSPIPASGEGRFGFRFPKTQDKVLIRIVEGKHGAPEQESREVDSFEVDGLPVDPKNSKERIIVRFNITASGVAEVTVHDAVSGKEFKRIVKIEDDK